MWRMGDWSINLKWDIFIKFLSSEFKNISRRGDRKIAKARGGRWFHGNSIFRHNTVTAEQGPCPRVGVQNKAGSMFCSHAFCYDYSLTYFYVFIYFFLFVLFWERGLKIENIQSGRIKEKLLEGEEQDQNIWKRI